MTHPPCGSWTPGGAPRWACRASRCSPAAARHTPGGNQGADFGFVLVFPTFSPVPGGNGGVRAGRRRAVGQAGAAGSWQTAAQKTEGSGAAAGQEGQGPQAPACPAQAPVRGPKRILHRQGAQQELSALPCPARLAACPGAHAPQHPNSGLPHRRDFVIVRRLQLGPAGLLGVCDVLAQQLLRGAGCDRVCFTRFIALQFVCSLPPHALAQQLLREGKTGYDCVFAFRASSLLYCFFVPPGRPGAASACRGPEAQWLRRRRAPCLGAMPWCSASEVEESCKKPQEANKRQRSIQAGLAAPEKGRPGPAAVLPPLLPQRCR